MKDQILKTCWVKYLVIDTTYYMIFIDQIFFLISSEIQKYYKQNSL